MAISVRGLTWHHLPLLISSECCFDSNIDICDKFQYNIIRRIGSNSVNGQVYEIHDTHGKRAAMKIFKDTNNREGTFALLFSDMESPHFPRVFSYSTCPKVLLNIDMFQYNNELLYMQDMATRAIPNTLQRKRASIIIRRNPDITMTGILTIAKDHGAPHSELSQIFVQCGIPMESLTSELLAGDLAQILLHPTPNVNPIDIIADFLLAYLEMVHRGISHGDMHIGNVLVRITSSKNYAVIHDFGTCENVDEGSIEPFQKDLLTFWNSVSAITGEILQDLPSHFSAQIRQCIDDESLKSCIKLHHRTLVPNLLK